MNERALTNACKPKRGAALRVGVDIVCISRIRESLDAFGERFVERLFSPDEAAYAAQAGALRPERLAARFAAKEATLKAFELSNAGINWRDIEVVKSASGGCRLALHGHAAALVEASSIDELALSLSHDGDYAVAYVAGTRSEPVIQQQPFST